MCTTLHSPAVISLASSMPLLPSLWRTPAEPEAVVADAFAATDPARGGLDPELVNTLSDLRRVSPNWHAGNFRGMLFGHARHYGTQAAVRKRLSAELAFYTKLFEPRAGDAFTIQPIDTLRHSPGKVSFSTIAFTTREDLLGISYFESRAEALILKYIQGATFIPSQSQRDAIGETWFEIFMERTLQALPPLMRLGVGLMLRIDDHQPILPRMVRDRYFTNSPDATGIHYPLNFGRERVQRILGAGAEARY